MQKNSLFNFMSSPQCPFLLSNKPRGIDFEDYNTPFNVIICVLLSRQKCGVGDKLMVTITWWKNEDKENYLLQVRD